MLVDPKIRGETNIQVQWFNKGSNLHRVWDSGIISSFGMSYTELANTMPKLSKKQCREIQQGTIVDWIQESKLLANEIYSSTPSGAEIKIQIHL